MSDLLPCEGSIHCVYVELWRQGGGRAGLPVPAVRFEARGALTLTPGPSPASGRGE
jgi:hypothetical protein